jgi:hypothetical protein
MSKPTPGPWMLGRDLPPERRELIRANEQAEESFDDHCVYGQASTDPRATWATYHPVAEFVEWPEDARLIAAAPELLEAAKALFDAAHKSPTLAIAFGTQHVLGPAMALRAAINKAEGGAE